MISTDKRDKKLVFSIKHLRRLFAAARDLSLGTNLGSLRLLSQPRSLRRYAAEALFLQKSLVAPGLHSRTVNQVLPFTGDLRLQHLPNGYNWFSFGAPFAMDLVSLCILCRALDARTIFEIGTFHGYSTLHLAMNSAPETRIYTLDLGQGTAEVSLDVTDVDHLVIEERNDACCFVGTEVEKKITRLFGDSAKFDFSPFAGKIDLFFIDGAHSYDYVKSDTLNAIRCCHPGSAIAWHDYGRPQFGVTRFLAELAREMEINVVPGGSLAFTIVK